MAELTRFQSDAVLRTRSILNQFDIEVAGHEEGVREKYLRFESGAYDLEIWIYVDEVAYRFRDVHVQCEKQDFDDDDEMLRFFLSSLEKELLENTAESG